MRKFILLPLILMAVSTVTVWAQQAADTTEFSKEEKQFFKLKETVEKDKEKLTQLYQNNEQLISERNRKQQEAGTAADRNTKSARKLSKESDNKGKAKKATKAAKQAESKAKAASKADAKVAKNEGQIKKLEKSIQKNEEKLRKLELKLSDNDKTITR